MSYYSSPLIIHNTTNERCFDTKCNDMICSLHFTVTFNKNKLSLSNSLIKQLLDSPAVKKYIYKECEKTLNNNIEKVTKNIKGICKIEDDVYIDFKVLGTIFYIKFFCGKNHTIEDCLKSLSLKLNNQKNRYDLLKG